MLQTDFQCPRWAELPGIPLYMDQVVMVVVETLAPILGEEPLITKTMINNYVKQKILPAPEGKKYGREQIARLVVVTLLKRAFSLGEINAILEHLIETRSSEQAYNLFCDRLEGMLGGIMAGGKLELPLGTRIQPDDPDALLDVAVAALVCKLAVQCMLID